jgi:hypothetical protein
MQDAGDRSWRYELASSGIGAVAGARGGIGFDFDDAALDGVNGCCPDDVLEFWGEEGEAVEVKRVVEGFDGDGVVDGLHFVGGEERLTWALYGIQQRL